MTWLFALGFSVLSLMFVLPPLWRRGSAVPTGIAAAGPAGRRATLKRLYLQRRGELEREAADGLLAATDLDQALVELDAGFLRETEALVETLPGTAAADPAGAAPLPGRRALVVLIAAATVSATTLLYGYLGEPDVEALQGAASILQLTGEDVVALQRWQRVLERRLARRPRDPKSLYLLGQIALKEGRYAAASAAFAAASTANGEPDPGIDLFWLQARFLAAGGVLDEPAREIAERVLAQSPNQPSVYEVLVIDAFRRQQYTSAVTLLNRALGLPLDEARRLSFTAGLAQARRQLGAGKQAGPAIDVTIEGLDALPGDRTLFVIARPPGGGMPFAVVRRPGPDYPRSVRLDDAVSMNPAQPLSAADTVEVVVRASASGEPLHSPGDWEWRSSPLSLQDSEEPRRIVAVLQPPGN